MSVFQTSFQNNLLPSLSMSANLYPSVTIQNIQKRSFASGDTFLDAGEVTERILAVVKSFDKCDASKVTPTAKFKEDLGLDSLDIVEVVMAIEEEFALEIPDNEADKITTIDVLDTESKLYLFSSYRTFPLFPFSNLFFFPSLEIQPFTLIRFV